MRFVELKTAEQLDIQSLHRVRSRLVGARTTLTNQLRAILLERGTTIAQGRRKLEQAVALLADPDFMAGRIRRLFAAMREEWLDLDRRIEALDREFVELARNDAGARCLTTFPGIGALNATALVAAVGDGTTFARALNLGAWLGLVPRQHTTGGKPRLLGISKPRQQIPAHAADPWGKGGLAVAARSQTLLGAWLRNLLDRQHRNTVVVALANKLARIGWVILRREAPFEADRAMAAA